MEATLVGIVGIVSLLVLLIMGVHVGIALGLVGFIGLAALTSLGTATTIASTSAFYFVTNYSLIVLPLYISMGLLASQAGIARDAYRALDKWIGHIRGGTGLATIGGCAAFGTCTGSAMVAAATFARVSAPSLRELGYDKRFTYGLIASSGAIAMLIPPSALAVVYGVLAEVSIGRLMLAGIGPGILMTAIFSLGILLIVRIRPQLIGVRQASTVSWRERVLAIPAMWPIGLVAAVIIGGMYTGLFTIVQAGAVGAFAIALVGLVPGKLSGVDIKRATVESVQVTAMVYLLFFSARIFSRFLVLSGITPMLINTIIGLNLSPIAFVIAIAILFVVLGALLDSISMIAIVIPTILPVIGILAIDPIWFAMVVLVAIHVGLITPPVGLNVFATKGAAEADVSLEDIFRGVLPFLLLMAITLVLVIAFPQISNWVPSLIGR